MRRNKESKNFFTFRGGLLSAAFVLGHVLPPLSFSEIYKYVDRDGTVHLSNVPDGGYNLLLKEGWIRFRLGADFEQYDPLIRKAAEKYRVDYSLVRAVIRAESNFHPIAASRKRAKGLMQLKPGAAVALAVTDSFQPEENIHGGVHYLHYLLDLFREDLKLALAAYNAGEKAVLRYKAFLPIGRR